MKSQPKAFYLINFISMWECFSYYGMRVLLVLYMTSELHYTDERAFGMYALYTSLVEFGCFLGGIAADCYLGLKRSIIFGAVAISLGHISMASSELIEAFYLGLGLIVAGTALFRSNVAAFLGKFYEDNDPRRDAGYTLYYTGINIGGFFAAIACGIVGETYGWHAGFGIAAIGMQAGLVALYFGRKLLSIDDEAIVYKKRTSFIGALSLFLVAPLAALSIYFYQEAMPLIPIGIALAIVYVIIKIKDADPRDIQGFKTLGVYLLFLILFYACEEQLGSSLVLFAERHVNRSTIFGLIPSASLVTFNPLTILTIGPLISRILQRRDFSCCTKIGLSFTFLSLAFALLYLGTIIHLKGEEISIFYAIGSIVLISTGEIIIGPAVYSAASQISPKIYSGLTMGLVALGYSIANLFSGLLSRFMTVTEDQISIDVYTDGFKLIASLSIIIGGALLTIAFSNNRIKKEVFS